MWERASREGVTTTHLSHICFPLHPFTVTQWAKNTGLGSIRLRERTEQLTHLGETVNSIKSTTSKRASNIHLPFLFSNGSLQEEQTHRCQRWKWDRERGCTFGLMRPEITQYLLKITVELADILGIELHEEKRRSL